MGPRGRQTAERLLCLNFTVSPMPGAPGLTNTPKPPVSSARTVPRPVPHSISAMWATRAASTRDIPSLRASFSARARLRAPPPLEPNPAPTGI